MLIEGIFIGIWFVLFLMLAIKSVNKMEVESKKVYIYDEDLEWWKSVKNCFK
jgi:hypothetical protein